MGRLLGHAATATRWAKPSTFAGKRNRPMVIAALTHEACKTLLRVPAPEEGLQLLQDMARQPCPRLLQHPKQLRQAFCDQPVQQRRELAADFDDDRHGGRAKHAPCRQTPGVCLFLAGRLSDFRHPGRRTSVSRRASGPVPSHVLERSETHGQERARTIGQRAKSAPSKGDTAGCASGLAGARFTHLPSRCVPWPREKKFEAWLLTPPPPPGARVSTLQR